MKSFVKILSISALVAAGISSSNVFAQATITNGTVQLSIAQQGHIREDANNVALTFVPTGNDALSPGCMCEGWGAGVVGLGAGRGSVDNGGVSNLTVASFTSTASTATSVVNIGSFLRVTHNYTPSALTPFLYQVQVSLTNTSGAAFASGDLRYRRSMDWDIAPTTFNELVTHSGIPAALGIANGSNILSVGDDGFAVPDPLENTAKGLSCALNANFVDCGPDDHGSDFLFQFEALAAGATRTFSIFYGAAPTEAQALSALASVGAGLYSLGQPSNAAGLATGAPNTYMFGFGATSGGVLTPVDPPSTVPVPGSALLIGFGLLALLRRSR
jgi:hypothetical protein